MGPDSERKMGSLYENRKVNQRHTRAPDTHLSRWPACVLKANVSVKH